MKKVIITGATGHIGNNVVRLLKQKGDYDIKLLLLLNENTSYLDGFDCRCAYGDICDKDYLAREIDEGSIVLHFAGIIDISSDKKDLMYKINVDGTKNVVDECIVKKCEKFIYVSSVHAIKEKKGNGAMAEPQEFDENLLIGDYAKSKCMATKYVFDNVKNGLNAVVIYPSGVFGPYDYKYSNTGKLVVDIANHDIKARINGSYNFVDVRDVAYGIYLALTVGKIGEGYILGGHPVSIDQIFASVQKNFAKPKFIPKIATWFVKMFAGLAELYYKVRKQKPLFTKYSLDVLTSNHNFDFSKAVNELGWTQRDFDKTISDTLSWFMEEKPELFKQSTIDNYLGKKTVE